MGLEQFLPFVLATLVILIIPGPTIVLVITQAVTHGRKSVMPLVAGVLLGDLTAMSLSLAGLGAILAASASLFQLFKWGGALYLVYLGVMMWRKGTFHEDTRENLPLPSHRKLFQRSFIVTALNPKSIAFFVAFLPQFIVADGNVRWQLVILGTTFLVLATVNAACYALFAGKLGGLIRHKRVVRLFNRCGGATLIGAGIVTAATRQTR